MLCSNETTIIQLKLINYDKNVLLNGQNAQIS